MPQGFQLTEIASDQNLVTHYKNSPLVRRSDGRLIGVGYRTTNGLACYSVFNVDTGQQTYITAGSPFYEAGFNGTTGVCRVAASTSGEYVAFGKVIDGGAGSHVLAIKVINTLTYSEEVGLTVRGDLEYLDTLALSINNNGRLLIYTLARYRTMGTDYQNRYYGVFQSSGSADPNTATVWTNIDAGNQQVNYSTVPYQGSFVANVPDGTSYEDFHLAQVTSSLTSSAEQGASYYNSTSYTNSSDLVWGGGSTIDRSADRISPYSVSHVSSGGVRIGRTWRGTNPGHGWTTIGSNYNFTSRDNPGLPPIYDSTEIEFYILSYDSGNLVRLTFTPYSSVPADESTYNLPSFKSNYGDFMSPNDPSGCWIDGASKFWAWFDSSAGKLFVIEEGDFAGSPGLLGDVTNAAPTASGTMNFDTPADPIGGTFYQQLTLTNAPEFSSYLAHPLGDTNSQTAAQIDDTTVVFACKYGTGTFDRYTPSTYPRTAEIGTVDLTTGQYTVITSQTLPAAGGNEYIDNASVSPNGRYIVFTAVELISELVGDVWISVYDRVASSWIVGPWFSLSTTAEPGSPSISSHNYSPLQLQVNNDGSLLTIFPEWVTIMGNDWRKMRYAYRNAAGTWIDGYYNEGVTDSEGFFGYNYGGTRGVVQTDDDLISVISATNLFSTNDKYRFSTTDGGSNFTVDSVSGQQWFSSNHPILIKNGTFYGLALNNSSRVLVTDIANPTTTNITFNHANFPFQSRGSFVSTPYFDSGSTLRIWTGSFSGSTVVTDSESAWNDTGITSINDLPPGGYYWVYQRSNGAYLWGCLYNGVAHLIQHDPNNDVPGSKTLSGTVSNAAPSAAGTLDYSILVNTLTGNVNAPFPAISGSFNYTIENKELSASLTNALALANGALSNTVENQVVNAFPFMSGTLFQEDAIPDRVLSGAANIPAALIASGGIGQLELATLQVSAEYLRYFATINGIDYPLISIVIRSSLYSNGTQVGRQFTLTFASSPELFSVFKANPRPSVIVSSTRSVAGALETIEIGSGVLSIKNASTVAPTTAVFNSATLKSTTKSVDLSRGVTFGINSARVPMDLSLEPGDTTAGIGTPRTIGSVTHYLYPNSAALTEIFY